MKLKLLSLLLALTLSSSLVYSDDYKYTEKNGIRSFHSGSLFVKEGVPFLTVKGESYEMGLQYGVLMNDRIMKLHVKIDSVIESYTGKFFVKKWIANRILKSKIRQIEDRMPVAFLQELEGMAEGCDLNLMEVKRLAYFPQLFIGLSCTAFVLKSDEGIVHGRNLDWPEIEFLANAPLIVNYHRKDKIPTTILSYVGYPGAFTGMNHNGLSMSTNVSACPVPDGIDEDDYLKDMPIPFYLRYVMENADELIEVDAMFEHYSTHGWLITVGSDKDKTGTIYDLNRGECSKAKLTDDFVSAANLSVSNKGRFDYSPIYAHSEYNIAREEKLQELNENISNGSLVDKAYQMVSSSAYYELPHDVFWENTINNDITVTSCVMDNTKKKIYFAYGVTFAGCNQFLKYDILSQEVSVYKKKQTIPEFEFLKNKMSFRDWFNSNYANKKELIKDDYLELIEKVKCLNLQSGYKYHLLSKYYSKIAEKEQAYRYAQLYVDVLPRFATAYAIQFEVFRDFKDYGKAIESLYAMLEYAHNSPADHFWAKRHLILMYDKLQG